MISVITGGISVKDNFAACLLAGKIALCPYGAFLVKANVSDPIISRYEVADCIRAVVDDNRLFRFVMLADKKCFIASGTNLRRLKVGIMLETNG